MNGLGIVEQLPDGRYVLVQRGKAGSLHAANATEITTLTTDEHWKSWEKEMLDRAKLKKETGEHLSDNVRKPRRKD